MALIDCPQCGEVVSDNSDNCFHCRSSLAPLPAPLLPRASSSVGVSGSVERIAARRATAQESVLREGADDLTSDVSEQPSNSERHKPQYADFALTAESAKNALERRKRRGEAAFKTAVVALGATGLYIAYRWLAPTSLGDWLLMVFTAWLIGAGGLIVLALSYALVSWLLLERLDPEVYRLGKFEDAEREYVAWKARTVRAYWMSLSPVRFEQEVAALYRSQGYYARLTPRSGDKGVDIFLTNSDETLIVQCKTNEKPVGPSVARELVGTLELSECDGAILVSRSGFTNGVHEVASARSIRLVGLQEILGMARS